MVIHKLRNLLRRVLYLDPKPDYAQLLKDANEQIEKYKRALDARISKEVKHGIACSGTISGFAYSMTRLIPPKPEIWVLKNVFHMRGNKIDSINCSYEGDLGALVRELEYEVVRRGYFGLDPQSIDMIRNIK